MNNNNHIAKKDLYWPNYYDHVISTDKSSLHGNEDSRVDDIFIRSSHCGVRDDLDDEILGLLCSGIGPLSLNAIDARDNILSLLNELEAKESLDPRDIAFLKVNVDNYENELKAQSSLKWISHLVSQFVSQFFSFVSYDPVIHRAKEIYENVSSKASSNEIKNLKVLELSLINRDKPYKVENLIYTRENKVYEYSGQIRNGIPIDSYFSKEVYEDKDKQHLGNMAFQTEEGVFKRLSVLVDRTTNNFSHFLKTQLISFKIKKCWVKAHCMMLEGRLFSDKTLMKKAEIKLASGVAHRECDILSIFTKKIFGDNFLVPSRNIATKKVLKTEEDKKAYLELRQQLSNNLNKMIGFDEMAIKNNFKDQVEPKSAKRDGVCFSASMYFIAKTMNGADLTEELLIQYAKGLEKGVPAEVAAIQEIYEEFEFKEVQLEINKSTSLDDRSKFCAAIANIIYEEAVNKGEEIPLSDLPNIQKIVAGFLVQREKDLNRTNIIYAHDIFMKIDIDALINTFPSNDEEFQEDNSSSNALKDLKIKISKATRILQNEYTENYKNEAIARLYHFEKDIKGMGGVNSSLGSYADKKSSKEHLENLSSLEEGPYAISFSTEKGGHAIVFIKTKNVDYIFDPNYGLIRCDKNASATLLKLLSLYRPPAEKLKNENEDRNYCLRFTKYHNVSQNLSQILY